MTVTIKKVQAVGKMEISDKEGHVIEATEEVVEEFVVDKPMANVGLKVGRTKNLGDYNSVRVDVSLFMPSELDKKSLDKAFKKCFKWCDKKLDEVLE